MTDTQAARQTEETPAASQTDRHRQPVSQTNKAARPPVTTV